MVNVVDFSGSRAAFQHPPSSTTNHAEPREAQGAALQRGNTSCSPGCFPSPELNPNEWSRREMIQTWRELWCQLREIWHQTPAGTRWEIEIYLRCFCTSSLGGTAHVSARKYKLHRKGLLALSGNYSPKRLRDMWAPFSGVPSDPAAYSRLRDTSTPWLPQSKKSLKVPNQPTPSDNWGTTHPELSLGVFLSFFLQNQDLAPTGFSFLCWLFCPLSSWFCSVASGWPTTAWGMQSRKTTSEHWTLSDPSVLKAPLLNQNFLKSKKFPAGRNFSWL